MAGRSSEEVTMFVRMFDVLRIHGYKSSKITQHVCLGNRLLVFILIVCVCMGGYVQSLFVCSVAINKGVFVSSKAAYTLLTSVLVC